MRILKNKNGFSLLEIVLGLGLISLASAAIYANFNSKKNTTNINRQALLLNDLSERAIRAFSASSTPGDVATTANLIAMKSVPVDLYDPNLNVITNIFGGVITVSGTNHTTNPLDPINPVPKNESEAGTITLTLNNIPNYACNGLGATAYADNTYAFSVNGVAIKNPGETPSNSQIDLLSNNCLMDNANVMSFTHSLYQPDLLDFRIVGDDTRRAKELPINIADIGPATVPVQACLGGATWSTESVSCVCPATSSWDGSSCVPFNTGIGNCEPGFGWNGNSCVPHQHLGKVGSWVPLKNHDFDMPVGSSVPNAGMSLENGRRILRLDYPREIIYNEQTNSVLPSGKITKEECLDPALNPNPSETLYWNGYSCVACTNGSSWDLELKRCISTGESANK